LIVSRGAASCGYVPDHPAEDPVEESQRSRENGDSQACGTLDAVIERPGFVIIGVTID